MNKELLQVFLTEVPRLNDNRNTSYPTDFGYMLACDCTP